MLNRALWLLEVVYVESRQGQFVYWLDQVVVEPDCQAAIDICLTSPAAHCDDYHRLVDLLISYVLS